jgi:Neuraminidase (sialidase)
MDPLMSVLALPCYRIPAIVQASPNVLLAFAEGRKDSCSDTGDIDVVMRRSEDGGSTWQNMIAVLSKDIGVPWEHHGSGQQTWGNPTVLYDEAKGRVWLFVTHNLGVDDQEGITKLDGNQGLRTIWNMHSDDDGRTWSAPFFLGHELQNPDLSVVRKNGTAGAIIEGRRWLIGVDVKRLGADGPSGVFGWSGL